MVASFTHIVAGAAMRGAGQDRAVVVEVPDGLVVALADGAGGTAHGALAAQAVIDAVTAAAGSARSAARPAADAPWPTLLSLLDSDRARIGHGQTTAIILSITPHALHGASVGDSAAWLLGGADIADIADLTAGQHRKPLLGAGGQPCPIVAGPLGDRTLLVASDGLFRYAKPADIARIATGPDLGAAANALIALVRLPSGRLQDDIAIVLVRQTAA